MSKLLPMTLMTARLRGEGVHCGLIHTDFRTPKRLVNWRPFPLATITGNARKILLPKVNSTFPLNNKLNTPARLIFNAC